MGVHVKIPSLRLACLSAFITVLLATCPSETDHHLENGDTHIFHSPRWPRPYPGNDNCQYHLSTIPGNRIYVEVIDFRIEFRAKCDYDYLQICDGAFMSNTTIGLFCGEVIPVRVVSSTQDILIQFISDETMNDKGFRAIAFSLPDPHDQKYNNSVSGCEASKVISGDKGLFASSGYPYSYSPNKLCGYHIISSLDTILQINFKVFEIEASSSCHNDYVAVYDGSSSSDPLIGRYCGGHNEPPSIIQGSANNLYIEMATDGSSQGIGFLAQYATTNIGLKVDVKSQEKDCADWQIPCLNGFCVHRDLICDGVDDCGDNTDEFCFQAEQLIVDTAGGIGVFVGCFVAVLVIAPLAAVIIFLKFKKRNRVHVKNYGANNNNDDDYAENKTAA